jgi:hypothetical protein
LVTKGVTIDSVVAIDMCIDSIYPKNLFIRRN